MTYDEAIRVMQEARVIAPALVAYAGSYHAFSRTRLLGSGASYEAALRSAKLLPRRASRKSTVLFTVNETTGNEVYRGEQFVCVARSHNIALRIANALNAYTPGDRGF